MMLNNQQTKRLTEQEMQIMPLPGEVLPTDAAREMLQFATKISINYNLSFTNTDSQP